MTTQDKILAAAQELFGELGYSGTTFKKIAERGEITLGLITHHFRTKERLYVECSVQVLEEVKARVQACIDAADTGKDKVRAFIRCYLDCSEDKDLNFKILVSCSPYSDVQLAVDKNPVTARFEQLNHIMAKCLIAGMEDGSVRECDSLRTAELIYATIIGCVRTRLLSPFDSEGLYRDAVEFLMARVERR